MIRFLAVGALAGLVMSGCRGDDAPTLESYSVVAYTTTSTVPAPSTTAVPDLQYSVVRGDSLYRIADQFCTTAPEIAAANKWPDGMDHVIYPGDTISVPGPGCPVESTTAPSTTVAMNPYLERYLEDGTVTDPFDPNAANHLEWGPACYNAYWAAQAFAAQGSSKASLMTALAALPAAVPATLIAQIDLFAPFAQQWFPVYVNARDRIAQDHPMYPDIDAFYRALLTDPEYLSLLIAYEAVGPEQFAARYWVNDLCDGLLATRGSTP